MSTVVATAPQPQNRFPEWDQSFTAFGSFQPGELGAVTTASTAVPLVAPATLVATALHPNVVVTRGVSTERIELEVQEPIEEVAATASDAEVIQEVPPCVEQVEKEASSNGEQVASVEETDPERWVDSKLAEEGKHGLPTIGGAIFKVSNYIWSLRRLYPAVAGWGFTIFVTSALLGVEIDGKPAIKQSLSGWLWLWQRLPVKIRSTFYVLACLVGIPAVVRLVVDFYREYVRKEVVAEDLESSVRRQAAELKADPELLSTLFLAVMYTRRDDRKMVELKRRGESWIAKNRPKWSPQVKLEQTAKCCLAAMCFTVADDQAQNTLSWGSVWERLNVADMSAKGMFSNGRVLPKS